MRLSLEQQVELVDRVDLTDIDALLGQKRAPIGGLLAHDRHDGIAVDAAHR